MTLTQLFTAIANAIRAKKGTQAPIVAEDFPSEISSIVTQPNLQNKQVTITTNTTTNIAADSGYDGLGTVAVTTNVAGDFVVPAGMKFGYSTVTELPSNMDFSNVSDFYNIFRNMTNLVSVDINTSNCTYSGYMFNSCSKLENIPVFDMSKNKNFQNMFVGCSKLTRDSLNNIMAMCIGATLYTGTKTLNYLGLDQTLASRCTQLSNYEAFVAAGWSTGY